MGLCYRLPMADKPGRDRRVGDATQARIDNMASGWKSSSGKTAVQADQKTPEPSSKTPEPSLKTPEPSSKTPVLPAQMTSPSVPPRPFVSPQGAAHTIPRSMLNPSLPGVPSSEVFPLIKAQGSPLPSAQGSPLPSAQGSPLPSAHSPAQDTVLDAEVSTLDPTLTQTPVTGLADELEPSGTDLRPPASLPRRSGLLGDMLYVGNVVVGRARLRRRLRETEMEIEAEKRSRDKELAEFARLVVTDETLSSPLIDEARDQLVELEVNRSREAGAAIAATQAINTILRDREQVKEIRKKEAEELEANISSLESKIASLEKKRSVVGSRARKLIEQLKSFDLKIAASERAHQDRDSTDSTEFAMATAALAGLRTEREVLAGGQPELTRELIDVERLLRELKAERGECSKRASKLRRAEDESIVRSEEKVVAVRAHKTVVDRAAADRTREQNELLRDVGERLYNEPPDSIAHLAKPLDERVVRLESLKADAVESKEMIASVEQGPFYRGVLLWLVLAFAVAGFFWLTMRS